MKTLKLSKNDMFRLPKKHLLSETKRKLVIKGKQDVRMEYHNGTFTYRRLSKLRKNWPDDVVEIDGIKYKLVKP